MPASRDILAELLVERLAPAQTLAILEGRVWHGELATIPDPVYPLLTFHREGTVQDYHAPASVTDMVVVSHSTVGQDQAWSIHAAARTLLDNAYMARDEVAFRLRMTVGPIPDPLRAPTPLFRVITIYRVQMIEA